MKMKKKFDRWVKKYSGPYIIESKLDGISALVHFRDGKYIVYTRGDGEIWF